MSNFIDKLSNKIQGTDDKAGSQYQTEGGQKHSGTTRSGQQQQNIGREQQFATDQQPQQFGQQQQEGNFGSGQNTASLQGAALGGAGGPGGRQPQSQGFAQGQQPQGHGLAQGQQRGQAQDISSIGQGQGGNQVEDWDNSDLSNASSGRQTRSQGGQGVRQGQQQSGIGGQVGRELEDKYVNRNL